MSTSDIVDGYARVGYFVQWGIYGRRYFVKNLDTSGTAAKSTHLNYAFGNTDPVNLTCLHGVTKGTSPDSQASNHIGPDDKRNNRASSLKRRAPAATRTCRRASPAAP